jgi:hypothetical protein
VRSIAGYELAVAQVRTTLAHSAANAASSVKM